MAPRVWNETGLVAHFRRMHENMPDRKFCFVLGAGASFRSGIPVGGQLVARWLREVWEQESHGQPFETWATEDNLSIPGFTLDQAASFYPQVFVRRFGNDPQEGYAWLERVMESARPSFGYFVLARILTQTRHNIVITTNFDNLVAEALAMSGGGHPLVVGHESLAAFVSSSPRRAVIAKIHRDLLLAPVNDPHGTSHLPEDWNSALRRILGAYTPLFLGYGGNDGSLMGFLDGIGPRHIPGQPVWCYWYRDTPAPHIVALMDKLGGVMTPIRDFDELMMRLNDGLQFGLPIERVTTRANEMMDRCRAETETVLRRLQESAPSPAAPTPERPEPPAEQAASLRAARESIERTDEPWAVVLRARMTADMERRVSVFDDGLRRFPRAAELRAEYAKFLAHDLGQVDKAEELLRAALPDPAQISSGRDPERATLQVALAELLAMEPTSHDEAERLYEAAMGTDPQRAATARSYANFLTDVRHDMRRAERLYDQAFSAGGAKDSGILCDFAVFLSDHKGDLGRAESLYELALKLEPENTVCLANLTELLLRTSRPAPAEIMALRLWAAAVGDPARQAVAALMAGMAALLDGRGDVEALGRLKGLLPLVQPSGFSFDLLLDHLGGSLGEAQALYAELAQVIAGELPVTRLDAHERWQKLRAVPPDRPWEAPLGS